MVVAEEGYPSYDPCQQLDSLLPSSPPFHEGYLRYHPNWNLSAILSHSQALILSFLCSLPVRELSRPPRCGETVGRAGNPELSSFPASLYVFVW